MTNYYRVFDEQTGSFMGFGYNARSVKQVADAYIDYKSIDWQYEEDTEYYSNLSISDKIDLMLSDEFILEKSNRKFKEEL